MSSRYDNRRIVFNRLKMYSKKAKERGIEGFKHYTTPEFSEFTEEEYHNIDTLAHIWTVGDKYYKLAHTHYGKPEYWWVIAWFNNLPTEAHLDVGDTVYIPFPLEELLGSFYEGRE